MKSPTIRMAEIAALARVSKSTVSRVLQNSPSVSQETRRLVETVMKAHRYIPNVNAAQLKQNRTSIVSVIVPLLHDDLQSMTDPFFMQMLGRLCETLSRHGYDLLLSTLRVGGDRDIGHVVRQRRADGIILIGQSALHAQINDVAIEDVSLVVWGAPIEGQSYATVSSDNEAGARMAVRHLLQTGRRHIAFFGNPGLPETRPRFDGYRAALLEAGIAADPALLLPVSFDRAGALQEIRRFLAGAPAFDGVFAVSDVIAQCAIDALHGTGRSVPRDVAVVGFDDVAEAAHATPSLTTIRQDIAAAADALVALLLEQIDGRPRRSLVLPTTLVCRQSTAIAP